MRRLVRECPQDGFRTSPLVFADDAEPLGLDAASAQLSEHTLEQHADSESVWWQSVDMPEPD